MPKNSNLLESKCYLVMRRLSRKDGLPALRGILGERDLELPEWLDDELECEERLEERRDSPLEEWLCELLELPLDDDSERCDLKNLFINQF